MQGKEQSIHDCFDHWLSVVETTVQCQIRLTDVCGQTVPEWLVEIIWWLVERLFQGPNVRQCQSIERNTEP